MLNRIKKALSLLLTPPVELSCVVFCALCVVLIVLEIINVKSLS